MDANPDRFLTGSTVSAWLAHSYSKLRTTWVKLWPIQQTWQAFRTMSSCTTFLLWSCLLQAACGLKETDLGLMQPSWNWALGHDWGLIRTGSLGINKHQLSIFYDTDPISGRNACVVCRIVLSTWHRLKSSQRRESQLRKCLHMIRLWKNL